MFYVVWMIHTAAVYLFCTEESLYEFMYVYSGGGEGGCILEDSVSTKSIIGNEGIGTRGADKSEKKKIIDRKWITRTRV